MWQVLIQLSSTNRAIHIGYIQPILYREYIIWQKSQPHSYKTKDSGSFQMHLEKTQEPSQFIRQSLSAQKQKMRRLFVGNSLSIHCETMAYYMQTIFIWSIVHLFNAFSCASLSIPPHVPAHPGAASVEIWPYCNFILFILDKVCRQRCQFCVYAPFFAVIENSNEKVVRQKTGDKMKVEENDKWSSPTWQSLDFSSNLREPSKNSIFLWTHLTMPCNFKLCLKFLCFAQAFIHMLAITFFFCFLQSKTSYDGLFTWIWILCVFFFFWLPHTFTYSYNNNSPATLIQLP